MPCGLIERPVNGGAAVARNCGAAVASGSLLLLVAAPLSIRFAWVGAVALTLIALFLVLNRGFLASVLRQRGWWFTLEAAAMTWFAYLYSALGALAGFAGYLRERLIGGDEMAPDA